MPPTTEYPALPQPWKEWTWGESMLKWLGGFMGLFCGLFMLIFGFFFEDMTSEFSWFAGGLSVLVVSWFAGNLLSVKREPKRGRVAEHHLKLHLSGLILLGAFVRFTRSSEHHVYAEFWMIAWGITLAAVILAYEALKQIYRFNYTQPIASKEGR